MVESTNKSRGHTVSTKSSTSKSNPKKPYKPKAKPPAVKNEVTKKTSPEESKAKPKTKAPPDFKGLHDYECPIDYELCAQPVVLPCKHTVCLDCSRKIIELGLTCPLCRAHFDKLFVPAIDKDV